MTRRGREICAVEVAVVTGESHRLVAKALVTYKLRVEAAGVG